jgi:anhydro-N-acetylmuramic acid kinase
MSGTSLDAIDAVLVRFDDRNNRAELLASREHPFPDDLRAGLLDCIIRSRHVDLDDLGRLHRQLGLAYSAAVNELLAQAGMPAREVTAVGMHGQTIRHQPDALPPFTLQIGDAATIAATCGIATVSDFRSADIACGGQGAPLAPAFHQWAFGSGGVGAVLNLGGIANITVLGRNAPPLGYDTGPSNTLLDIWYQRHHPALRFDANGAWSAQGQVCAPLLERMLADPYFLQSAPKSTGREHFNAAWLEQMLEGSTAQPVDVQATLAELTARSVADALRSHLGSGSLWVCGGGARNTDLISRLQRCLPEFSVAPTDSLGIPAEWVEAVAFAWLARARLRGEAAGIPSVSGANRAAVLGCVHLPAEA